jgi:hypothetical protein
VAALVLGLTVGCFRAVEPPMTFRGATRLGIRMGAVAATAGVAYSALGELSMALASFLLLLGVATAPWCVTQVVRLLGSGRDRPPTTTVRPGAPAPEALVIASSGVSDGELCRAWRASFAALLEAPDLAAREQVVRLRQDYLDELIRRHPEPVRAWLASGPRAASGPERYLQAPYRRDCDAA